MDRFLVESPHTADECKRVVQDVHALGYLYNTEWGCGAGVHESWVIIEAENATQALQVVPHSIRKNARAVKLEKFDAETVKSWGHQSG